MFYLFTTFYVIIYACVFLKFLDAMMAYSHIPINKSMGNSKDEYYFSLPTRSVGVLMAFIGAVAWPLILFCIWMIWIFEGPPRTGVGDV